MKRPRPHQFGVRAHLAGGHEPAPHRHRLAGHGRARADIGAFKKLWDLGKDLVNGIKNGFVNAWNGFISSVGNLFSGFVSWIKKLLGISSPSKVMAAIGSDTAKGWLLGLQGEEAKIKDTAGRMVDAVVNAFKSGKITSGVKDHLVESIRSGNTELASSRRRSRRNRSRRSPPAWCPATATTPR